MTKYIASVSFGKDSLAMLLLILEKNKPLDEVIFYDTGMEFQAIYNIRDKVVELLKEKGIKYTELKPKLPFEYVMFEKPVKHRNGTISKGYSWCGGRCRWGTTEKNTIIKKYLKENYNDDYKEYIGIAYDEPNRIKDDNKKIYLLYDLKYTEKDCLRYCYSKGYSWEEDGIDLYSVLDRVSCWCCANKNLKELRAYYKYLPTYWNKLKELQSKTERPFRNNKESIFDLEERFKKEED
jgi:3'-phosphoadenosine 5'-phosphosulfate sulfotransferase (PAPS reductase)/FAD synthetase